MIYYIIRIQMRKLLAPWLLGIIAIIGLTTMVSGNSVIAQNKNARSFMILPVKVLESQLTQVKG
jgi:hypothetical protein